MVQMIIYGAYRITYGPYLITYGPCNTSCGLIFDVTQVAGDPGSEVSWVSGEVKVAVGAPKGGTWFRPSRTR